MAQWEPLADRIPVDVRRLATQLRRMKDRSGLTVPALAARTAQSAEAWAQYLNGRQVPPLDAVELLAQASGADYDRTGALWKLAEKAAGGTGDRGRGKPVPYPDPLDPLGAEEGLPRRRRRRALLLGAAGVLGIGALVTVLLAAGPSTGRAPAPDAGRTPTVGAGASGTTGAGPRSSSGAASPGRQGGPTAAPSVTVMLGGSPSQGAGESSAAAVSTAPGSGTGTGSGTGAGDGSGGEDGSGNGGGSVPTQTESAPATEPGGGTVSPPASPTATPSPTGSKGLCLGLIVLNVCLGGQG